MDSIVSENERSSLSSNSPCLPTTCSLFRKICQVLLTRNNVTHFPLLHRFAFTFNLFPPYTCSTTSSFPARRRNSLLSDILYGRACFYASLFVWNYTTTNIIRSINSAVELEDSSGPLHKRNS